MNSLVFKKNSKVLTNPPIQVIYEHILKANEGVIGKSGAMMIDTGEFTGRSPNDKYFVEENYSKGEPTSEDQFCFAILFYNIFTILLFTYH